MWNISKLFTGEKASRVQNLDMKWRALHSAYLLIFAVFLVFTIATSDPFSSFFHRITNFLLLFITINVAGTYFEKSYKFTLRYLVLPGFGLAWVVFAVRLSVDVFHGLDWLNDFVSANRSTATIPDFLNEAAFIHLFDFTVHFLPLLIMYQIIYVFAEELEKELFSIPLMIRYFSVCVPFSLIFVWAVVFDPFKIYLLHRSSITIFLLYCGIPVLLMFVNSHFYNILLPRTMFHRVSQFIPRKQQVSSHLELGILIILIMNIFLGCYLIGAESVYRSIFGISSSFIVSLLLIRFIGINKMHITALVMLPLLSFILGAAVVRELVFILHDGSHARWVQSISATKAHVLPYEMILFLYSVYLFVNYVIVIPFIGEMFFRKLPYSLKKISPIRVYLRKMRAKFKHKWLFDLWHQYGCLPLIISYLIFNRLTPNPYSIIGGRKQWTIELTYVLTFLMVSIIFSASIYSRQITQTFKAPRKKWFFF